MATHNPYDQDAYAAYNAALAAQHMPPLPPMPPVGSSIPPPPPSASHSLYYQQSVSSFCIENNIYVCFQELLVIPYGFLLFGFLSDHFFLKTQLYSHFQV